MDKMQILMLGESLERTGGIVSVQKLILKNKPDEIEIDHIPTLKDGSAAYKILIFALAMASLIWKLLTQDVDLVYIHVAERGSAFRQACSATIAWLFQKPIVMHSHTSDFHIFYAKLPPLLRLAIRWAFARADRFIVLSQSWQKYFVENLALSPERVVVLPNPVKIPLEIPQRVNSTPVHLLFLGKIGDRKGAFDLIAAIAALPPTIQQQMTLVMAGDGEVEKARSTVAALNLSDRITIFSWVDAEKIEQLLKSADVFILPSYNEGLPMALLEAMSWGLATISTPVGGIPEVVNSGENGLLVAPGDIDLLAKTIQSTIESESLRLSLGGRARETVRPLAVEKYCFKLTDIFSDAIAKNIELASEP